MHTLFVGPTTSQFGTHCFGGELITIENPSLSALGYQLLPLATSQLVSNNREFDVSGILEEFYSLFMEGSL